MSLNSVRFILLIRKRTVMPPLGNKAPASNATPVTTAAPAFSAKKHVTKGVNARLAATSGVLALLLAGVTPVAAHATDAPDNASAIAATTDNSAANNAAAAPAADHLVLEKGHVDAFNVTASNGALKLNLKEDVTGSHVQRDPSKVELHVKDAAKQTIPDGWPGAGQSYFLPQTQDHNLLWPGWDTLGTQGGGVDKHIDLEFTAVSGPGKVYLFGTNGFGGMEPLLKGGATELKAGAVREQTFPAHTHANWAFTKPGLYKITVKARGIASKSGATVESEEQTYYFTVGSKHKGTAFKKAEPKPQPAPENPTPAPEKPKPTPAPEKPKPTPQPEKPAPEKPQPKPEKKPAPEKPKPEKPKPAPAPDKQKPESQKPAVKKPAEKPASEKPEAVAPSKPVAEDAGAPAANAPQAPASPGAAQCMPVKEAREATQQEIEAANSGGQQGKTPATTGSATKGGTSALGASGLLPMSQVNGSATVPANSHVHPNWVFSKPGTYTVQIRQTATLKSGGTTSARATLRFNVGPGATGATNGHFDLGSQLNGKTLKASLKDDRKQPAAWVEPSSITFALGDAARVAAPAGIEFVAPKGSNVWMVPSTQIPGVPWIGANTMHPSLKDTTGPVTWTLESVSGPGNVAVFTSGNFGQIVGQRWFNSTAGAAMPGKQPGNGSSSPGTTSGAEGSKPTVTVSGIAKDQKSAKKGQLFKKGNKIMVVDTVGRTADGKPCALPQASGGSLARTGADVAHIGVAGGLLAAVGAGAFMVLRRARNAE